MDFPLVDLVFFLSTPLTLPLTAPPAPFLRAELTPLLSEFFGLVLSADLVSDFLLVATLLPALDFTRVRWRGLFDLLGILLLLWAATRFERDPICLLAPGTDF